MEKALEWKNIIMESIRNIWFDVSEIFPSILGAILIIVIGWIVTKIIVRIVKKALKFAKANKLDDVLNSIEVFDGKKLEFNTVKIVSAFVKWIMYIMIIIVVSDIMNFTIISNQINNLLAYLPKLFAALVIFTIGLVLANTVKKGLKSFFESMDLSGAKVVSHIVFFLILIFTSITALNQAGVNTEIITNNVTMILAAFLLSFALAFGFGAQKVVGEILKTFYARKIYEVGQAIEFDNIKGEVEFIDGISVVLKTKEGKLVVPINKIIESQVKIQG